MAEPAVLERPAAPVQPVRVSGEINVPAPYKICPKCGATADDDSRFCPQCAFDLTKIEEPAGLRTCPGCKKAYTPDDKFCRHCAFDLSTIQKTPSSAHFCTSCGKPFETSDKFCRHCAADLSNSSHTVAVPLPSNDASFINRVSIPVVFESEKTGIENNSKEVRRWISPSAAIFALICFFLPWVEVSCSALGTTLASRTASGADLAQVDSSLWLLPILGVGAIVAIFFHRSKGTEKKARPIIIGSSVLAMLFLLYKGASLNIDMQSFTRFELRGGWLADVTGEWRFGLVGMFASFAGMIVGSLVEEFSSADKRGTLIKYAALPQQTPNTSKPNKPAMFAYLLPLLSILSFPFFAGLWGNVSIIIWLAIFFGYPIYLFKSQPYADKPRTRFHAMQSIFLLGIIIVSGFGIGLLDKPRDYSAGSTFIIYLLLTAMIGVFIIQIFMAIKAYADVPLKLPFIGDRAESLVAQSEKRA